MKTLQELQRAVLTAQAELAAFKRNQFQLALTVLTQIHGEGVSVTTEDSEGFCNRFQIFGNVEGLETFLYIGRESLESCLKEAGFDNLVILSEDGTVERFFASDY